MPALVLPAREVRRAFLRAVFLRAVFLRVVFLRDVFQHHVIRRDLDTGFLEQLPARRGLRRFVILHVAAGQRPFADFRSRAAAYPENFFANTYIRRNEDFWILVMRRATFAADKSLSVVAFYQLQRDRRAAM